MKKIIFPILFFSITILQSCSDFNEKNFPGYDSASRPQQITNVSYQLTNLDYQNISTTAKLAAISKFSSDSIAIEATSNTRTFKDSVIKALTDTCNAHKVHAINISNNLSFSAAEPASSYVLYILPTLYKFSDPSSSVNVTYRTTESIDAITYNVAYNDTLKAADFTSFGLSSQNFSSTIDPNLYIPTYCKTKHPYALPNKVAKVYFQWYINATTTNTLVRYFKFDGTNWIESGKTDQFLMGSDRSWLFDPTITFVPTATDYKLLLNYYFTKFSNAGGVAPVAPATTPTPIGFSIQELEGYNDWTTASVGRFVINWKYPPSGTDISNVFTEYWSGTSWKYLDIDIRATGRLYADDIELHNYFAHIDSTSLSSTDKNISKTTFMEQRAVYGIGLLISIKYPNLNPQVKGVDQFVQIKIDEYDGGHKYWIYRYQCMEVGKFKYISRSKWK